jgi:AsmA-like protein
MKIVVRALVGLVVLLLLVGIGAGLFIDSLAKKAIESGGTHALGVETRLESASLGLISGRFALAGLSVANPAGFAEPDFFALRSTELELSLSTLLEPRITIPSLVLEGITLDLERNASGTNYGAILDSLERFESAPQDDAAGGPATEGGKTFLLQRLVIRDVRATVNLIPAGGDLTKLSLAVPEIVVEGLGSELSMPQLCALVVKGVVNAAIQAGGGVLPADLLADLRGRMDGLEGAARARVDEELGKVESKLEEQAKKLGPEAEKALQDASGKLGGKLDGLLKKKKE